MTRKQLKMQVKAKIENLAFQYKNIRKKGEHKKDRKLSHKSLSMSEYLEPNNFMIKQNEAKTLFQLKSKMVQVKANYSSAFKGNLNCTLCSNEGKTRKETQKHIVKCPVITRRNPNK